MAFNYNNLSDTIRQLNSSVSNIRGSVSTGITGYFDLLGGTNSKLRKNQSLHIPDADGIKLTDKNIEVFYTFYLLLAQTLQDAKTLQGNEEESFELNKEDRKHIDQLEEFLQPFVSSLSEIKSITGEPETIAPFLHTLYTAGLLKVLTTLEMQPKSTQKKDQQYELSPEQLTAIWDTINSRNPVLKQAYVSLYKKVEAIHMQVLEAEKQKQQQQKQKRESEHQLTEKSLADNRANFSSGRSSPSSDGHTDHETNTSTAGSEDQTGPDSTTSNTTPKNYEPTSYLGAPVTARGRYHRSDSDEQREKEARSVKAEQYKLCQTLWSDSGVHKMMASNSSLMEKKNLLLENIKENTLFNGNTIPLNNGQTLHIKITTNNQKSQTYTTNISLTIQEPEPFLSRSLRAFINLFRRLAFYPPLKQAEPSYTSFSVNEEKTLSPKVITRHYDSESHPGIPFIQSIGRALKALFKAPDTVSPTSNFTYEPAPINEPEPEQKEVKSGENAWIPFSYRVKDEKKPTPEKKLAELGLCKQNTLMRPTVILDKFNEAEPDSDIANSLQKDFELFNAFIALVIKQQALAYNSINTKLSQWESTNPGSFQKHLEYLKSPERIEIVTKALEADKTGFNKDDKTQTQALQNKLAGMKKFGNDTHETLRSASKYTQKKFQSASSIFSSARKAGSSNKPSKK